MSRRSPKMQVEIWSDVMCPFCYIGKRRFDQALASFDHKDQVEPVWKSFQLAPDIKTSPGKNLHQYLAEHKGISLGEAKQMNARVTEMARQAGLTYRFDQAVVANSRNAHRFSHFARHHGRQHEAEELLFHAYFTEGKNIDDYETLIQLGVEIGLDEPALRSALEAGSYDKEVQADIQEANEIGIRGVPFFIFDHKYAVSGAQSLEIFQSALNKSFTEWSARQPSFESLDVSGNICTPGGDCQ